MVQKKNMTKNGSRAVVWTLDAQELQHELQQCRADLSASVEELQAARKGQQRAEELLREKTVELTTANQELDAFIGSVTHGLCNSLQTITGFSQTLLKFYYDSLDETGKDCLTRIGTGTKKMKAIIESLVELSWISGQEMNREKVNLSEITEAVWSSIRASNPDRIAECSITPGLIADADPGMARILLENLLQNAWKFTSQNERTLIEFGAVDGPKSPFFFVRDNGVGFDPSHKDKLFKPFQHLHKEEAFKGSGIGLTAVKRIIHKHGGSVRVEAEKGKGATFYFQFSPS
jgi:light-regulated signal transduction histidine kinase (bacteriophytochrome)